MVEKPDNAQRCNHKAEEERVGCFTLIVFLLLCGCQCLLVMVPWVGLWSVIVAFPDHTHLFS